MPENLKRGNTVNVGRKRNEVRRQYLNGAGTSAVYIKAVAAGKRVVLVPPKNEDDEKSKPTYRYPTFDERRWAMEQCLKYGLGTDDSKRISVKDLTDEQIIAFLEGEAEGGGEEEGD